MYDYGMTNPTKPPAVDGARFVGRPTDYRPEYCERVVELGKQGKSKAQIAVALDVVRNTLDLWAKANPEFLSAMQRAREESQNWWELQAQGSVYLPHQGGTFNAALWSKIMNVRFPDDYREKQEVSVDHRSSDGTMSPKGKSLDDFYAPTAPMAPKPDENAA